MKTCSGCGQEKLLTDFHKWRHSKDGHRARCKACRKPESQQYHQEHKEEIAAYHAKWFEGNKERERRRKMAWRHKNKPKVQARARRARARHHEARRQYINTWRKLNPARYRLQKYRRRCAEAQGIITEAQWVDALFWFGYRCLACGSTDAKLCIDHVIPLSRGGANSIANVQPLCRSCNSKKHANYIDYRTPADVAWLASLEP